MGAEGQWEVPSLLPPHPLGLTLWHHVLQALELLSVGRGREEGIGALGRGARGYCNPSPGSKPEGPIALVLLLGRAMARPCSEGPEGHPTFPGL